ncbi:hypothetical protein [Sphingopyxis terrae]
MTNFLDARNEWTAGEAGGASLALCLAALRQRQRCNIRAAGRVGGR